jgi:hypothetical protein
MTARIGAAITLLALVSGCGASGEGPDAGPDAAGVDWGGDAGPIDTQQHPDVPPVLPDGACGGNAPIVTFSHGFEPGERLPDDPGYHGFEMVTGTACPGAAGGARSLAWSAAGQEGAYASLPPLDLPAAAGGLYLSFCLVFDVHDGDLMWVDLVADGGDPETVWSSMVGVAAANPPVVEADLGAWAGQRVQLSFHFHAEGDLVEPPRDVRIDSVTVFTCPTE